MFTSECSEDREVFTSECSEDREVFTSECSEDREVFTSELRDIVKECALQEEKNLGEKTSPFGEGLKILKKRKLKNIFS